MAHRRDTAPGWPECINLCVPNSCNRKAPCFQGSGFGARFLDCATDANLAGFWIRSIVLEVRCLVP